MKRFLEQVAIELYKRLKGNFAHTAVIFPNKRASLFFNEYLVKQTDKPIWSPTYLSISELFQSMTKLKLCDRIELVCTLYNSYVKITGSTESLDDFYFWGELLISDFDDVDKNKVDAKRLFSNLEDLQQMATDASYLNEEQIEAINKFIKNYNPQRQSELKQKFKSIWESLGAIYDDFRSTLYEKDFAYEGMLYRDVIETFKPEQLPYQTYVFVGFNVLNKVEHELFEKVQSAGKALFFWDYDSFYLSEKPNNQHEAGRFLRSNLKDFPNAISDEFFHTLAEEKDITYIETSTDHAQTAYLSEWLKENITEKEKETAVVLCDEIMLQPVLYALPNNIKHVNVTMGFPLSQTPIYSFIDAFLGLHIDSYDEQTGRYTYQAAIALLKHPYTRLISKESEQIIQELTNKNRFFPLPSELTKDDEQLDLLFKPLIAKEKEVCKRLNEVIQVIAEKFRDETAEKELQLSGNEPSMQLYKESLFKIYTTINRFSSLIENGTLKLKAATLRKLIIRVLSAIHIPFHGEPAVGLQVMGVLETRNLDFKHLIMLSVNEGKLPKAGGEISFIPYNLRKAFGMTTIDHQMSVYAYYFYRLLQRAEKVTMLYNTATDEMNKGEWSRFLLQFLLEWPHPVKRLFLEAKQSPQQIERIEIPKTKEIVSRLRKYYDKRSEKPKELSPTAINAYIHCKLKFYLRYVAGLKAPEEVGEDIDNRIFGNIFHATAQHIYDDLKKRSPIITKDRLESLLKDKPKLRNYVDSAFKEEFFQIKPEEEAQYNGLQRINFEVILRYIEQLLRHDALHTPFIYVGSEIEIKKDYTLSLPDSNEIIVHLGGFIDRVDCKDDHYRIIDYKTGTHLSESPDIDSLFMENRKDGANYILQTFLYADMFTDEHKVKTQPALLYIQNTSNQDYTPIVIINKKKVEDYSDYKQEFQEKLIALLKEMFTEGGVYDQTSNNEHCKFCDYKAICKIKEVKR